MLFSIPDWFHIPFEWLWSNTQESWKTVMQNLGGEQDVLWEIWNWGNRRCSFFLTLETRVFRWKVRWKYFISDVTDAFSYRLHSCFFRIDRRNKDRPRLCRHHGFGSALRRAVLYQLINVWYKFTVFDHFDGFQFLWGSTAWIITEHLEFFNRALSLIESSTAASQKKWACGQRPLKKKILATEADGIDRLTIKMNVM